MLDFGILWMNARNLLYIKKFNPKKAIRLADNKFKTKQFLSARGIPVPQTFALIKNRQELFDFNRKSLPEKEFVIKPNKGSKGEGIMVVEMEDTLEETLKKFWRNSEEEGEVDHRQSNEKITDNFGEITNNRRSMSQKIGDKITEDGGIKITEDKRRSQKIGGEGRQNRSFLNVLDFDLAKFGSFFQKFNLVSWEKSDLKFKIGGQVLDYDEFVKPLVDILDWKYSLAERGDSILIEEKLEPGENFEKFCKYWLADIRVIVFNLIPVAAMVRVPTAQSGWKANLAQWWVGLGVEVWSWKIKSMYYNRKIFTDKFPGWFEQFYKKKLPFWDDILLYSSKIQYFVNIGYLALDWVITDEGPKLLEINARAGLEVQNASVVYLKKRLEKISDIKVTEPEKGVEIAKSLFTTEKVPVSLTKVVYLSQKANLILEWPEEDEKIKVEVDVDLNKEKNYISKQLYEKIQNRDQGDIILDLYESEVRFKNLDFKVDENLRGKKIVLWNLVLQDFYVKPVKKEYINISFINPEKIKEDELEKLQILDRNIQRLSSRLNLNALLTPVNYLDELDSFITWWWNYNPKFKYRRPQDEFLQKTKLELQKLLEDYFGNLPLKSTFALLFKEKIEELLIRVDLIQAYKRQKFDDILHYNQLLWWELDEGLYNLAKEKIFMEEDVDPEILWKPLTLSQAKKLIKQYLADKGIHWVKIITDASIASRISVARTSKKVVIKLSPKAVFREKEIYATLAHEIDIHLQRWLNGKSTWWEILKNGTWWYLKDEEGLAVWNSFKYLPEGYEKKGMYLKYYLLKQAQTNHFARLAEIYRGITGADLMKSFKWAFRLKKGVQNTWFIDKGAIWLKDKIYLEWYRKISNWIQQGGDVSRLMVGKIKIEDLEKIY